MYDINGEILTVLGFWNIGPCSSCEIWGSHSDEDDIILGCDAM